jgi:ABC-type enterochelin transport system permease subunit
MKSKLSFRELLTLILVFFAMSMLFYILINWGAKMEILTLLIGLIGGTVLGSITGTYYGSNHKNNTDETGNKG